jgi:putative transposase
LADGSKLRQDEWTDSIAVGSRIFIEKVKVLLGFRAKGRGVIEGDRGYQLREESVPYNAIFEPKKGDIVSQNTHF